MKNTYSYLLVAGMFAAAAGSANAQTWDGDTSTDFATGDNWDSGVAPAGAGNWTINNITAGTAFAPILTTPVTLDPNGGGGDAFVGSGGGTGTLDIDNGGTLNGSGNWFVVGVDAGSNGTVNVNSGGSITSDNQIRLGRATGTGNLNVNGGTVTVSAMDENQGTANIDISNSGTVEATGGNIRMPIGGGSMDSGSFTASGQIFIGGGAGVSTFDMTGGTLSTGSWLPVGIGANSIGTFNLSSGSVNVCQTDGAATIGTAGGTGVVNMSGGTWTNGSQGIILGEAGTGNGTFTLDAGDVTTTRFRVTIAATATGTVNLNGGTLSTGSMEIGTGTTDVNLNGTSISANADSTTFFSGGGVDLLADTEIDTAGFNVSGDADFVGAGGITKNGAGALSLPSDLHDIGGNLVVNAGSMNLGAGFSTPYAGTITVEDGATFGVRTAFLDDLIQPTDMAFNGLATSLNIDFVDPDFTIPSEPIFIDGGTLDVNGTTTINILGANIASGTYTLIDYSTASRTGTGTFALGTLPVGITAPGGIVELGSTVQITLIAPAPLWTGDVDGDWDVTKLNWEDLGTGNPTMFSSGNAATFDDSAFLFDVTTTEDVTPSLVKFQNDNEDYTLTAGGGVITGGAGLTKSGNGGLNISNMANSYTGITTLAGGTTTVDTLTNGGVASSLGAATSDPANLVFAGGTLNYPGAATSTDRGFSTVAGTGVGGFVNANTLTLTGVAGGGTGSLAKSGAGDVSFTNLTANTFGSGFPSLAINEATWTFDGSGGTLGDQNVTVPGELWVGATPNIPANLIIQESVVNVAGFIAMSRGNGDTSTVSSLTLNDSTMTSGNFSTGFMGGEATNDVVSNVTINGSSTLDMGGVQNFAENANAVANITVNGTAILTGDRFLLGLGADSQADLILNDSAKLVLENSWTAVGAGYNGANANGSITLNGSSTLTDSGDAFNIGDVDGGHGVVTINDMATVTLNGGGTVFVGKGNTDTSDATGIINVNGGSFTTEGIISLGTRIGTEGAVNVTGGIFTQNDVADRLIVGDQGTGTLSVSGSGMVMVNGTAGLIIGEDATGVGVVDLNSGGIINANLVTSGAGSGTINFDGGTLQAKSTNANFLNVANTVIGASGGTIDNANFDITIASSVSGAGDWSTAGAGITTLSASNSNSGILRVTEGITRTTSTTTLHESSGVDVKTGATLNLNFTGDQIVQYFLVNGVDQGDGTYSATLTPGLGLAGTGNLVVQPFVASAYDNWIAGFFPGDVGNPLIVGPDADPDMDGQSNKVEFALGGEPDNGGNNAKVYSFSTDRLLMTIAVLDTTPAFGAGPAPSATIDGCTYTITGSDGLAAFTSAVSVEGVNDTGLPMVPAGYEYRTFSLDSSIGLPDHGFMRVEITP